MSSDFPASSTLSPVAPAVDPALPQAGGKFNGFYWPTPPYATYREADPWTEPQLCEVEGLNGTARSCLLVSITPAEKLALIQIPRSRANTRLQFAQFMSLTLKEPVLPDQGNGGALAGILDYRATLDYDLHLINGSQRNGQTVGYVETHFGLFLFTPLDLQGSIERIFVPREAYLNVNFGEHIGQLLVAQNAVTPLQVEQAAAAQAALRNRKLGDFLVSNAIVSPDQLMAALEQQARMPMIRVGEALTGLGYVSQGQLLEALERQKTERSVPLGELLVRMGFLSRRDLNMALARKMGYPVVDLTQFPIEADALRKVPQGTAHRLGIMPLVQRGNMLVLAAADPTRREMIEELEFALQIRVIAVLAGEEQISQLLSPVYEKFGLRSSASVVEAEELMDEPDDELHDAGSLLESLEMQQDGVQAEAEQEVKQSDNSLVRLINTMIMEAHGRGVSDIHIETHPGKAKVRIRFRKDGILSPYLELPHTYRSALVARLKIMADLDISERRKPQDGKINFARFAHRYRLELRVATIPTANGLEDVVMRLLSSTKPLDMDKLGLSAENLRMLRAAVDRPYGLVLCVGPTGSGKTTTLHSVLGYLNTPQRKIWTAEDPIEITQSDLRQVQINPKIDWTFAKALRAFLRADPDVIMVGEIRDQETAQIAIEASLTGHLVLSTLHTNSAAETVTRLIDMGMDPFNFADSLLAVLAQRLVRRLCIDCRSAEPAEPAFIEELLDDYLQAYLDEFRPPRQAVLDYWQRTYGSAGQLHRYRSKGCLQCSDTGLRGRVGLHELMCTNPALRRLIQINTRPELIQHESLQNGKLRTLRQDGIHKVLSGLVSIEEVRANTNA